MFKAMTPGDEPFLDRVAGLGAIGRDDVGIEVEVRGEFLRSLSPDHLDGNTTIHNIEGLLVNVKPRPERVSHLAPAVVDNPQKISHPDVNLLGKKLESQRTASSELQCQHALLVQKLAPLVVVLVSAISLTDLPLIPALVDAVVARVTIRFDIGGLDRQLVACLPFSVHS
jgi:hypothetical protein